MQSKELPTFERIIVCFEAIKKGSLEVHKLFLGLDGYHLKGSFSGILLHIVSMNGNKELFPVAYSMVETEYKDSWRVFLKYLYVCIDGGIINSPLIIMYNK